MKVIEHTGCLLRIQNLYRELTGTERIIADYVLSHDDIIHKTITQVVKATAASYGSVDRFCKKLGYSGFQDLKIHLAEDLARRRVSRHPEGSEDPLARAARTAARDIESTIELLSLEKIEQAARLLVGARFVLVAGLSSSAGTAMGIDYRLGRYGIRSACAVDNHIQRHRAATLGGKDAALLLSFSGSTREILATARIAKKSGAALVGLTNYLESPITEIADISLVTGIESDPLGAEIASKVAVEFVVTVLFERIAKLLKSSRSLLSTTFEATADRQL